MEATMKQPKQRKKRQILSPQARTDLTGYSFLLPNLIGCALFTFIPVLFSLFISFTDWDYTKGFGSWNFVGFQNFIDMWSDEWFVDALKNTLVYTIAVVPITIFLALILSVLIDKYCFAKLPIRLAMLMPYISNVVAVAIVWVMMYSSFGPVTQLVKALGVENPPKWLADYKWAMPAIILMTIWSNVGYSALIYTSSIQGLPQDVYEAADMDGANEIVKFFKLTIPFLTPHDIFPGHYQHHHVVSGLRADSNHDAWRPWHVDLCSGLLHLPFGIWLLQNGLCVGDGVDFIHFDFYCYHDPVAWSEALGQLLRRRELWQIR